MRDETLFKRIQRLESLQARLDALASGQRTAIVFRPGGTPSNDVAVTWGNVQSFIASADLPVTVYIDDSIVSPALVPSSSGVTDGKGTTILSAFGGLAPTLEVQDGATLHDFAGIVSPDGPIEVVCDCATTQALSFTKLGQFVVSGPGSELATPGSAAVPIFSVAAGQTFLLTVTGDQSTILNAGASVIASLGAGATLQVDLVGTTSNLGAGQIASGAVGTTLTYTHDVNTPSLSPSNVGTFAGTVADVRASEAVNLLPSQGPTVGRPTGLARLTGQMFFDTTIGKPVWWNGATWVDATGAPA